MSRPPVGQLVAAKRVGISLSRQNEIVLGKRGITADTALRLARLLKTSPATRDATAGRLGFARGYAAAGAAGVVAVRTVDSLVRPMPLVLGDHRS